MQSLYQRDLAYIHASAFEALARGAASEIVQRLRRAGTRIQRVLDIGCGAGPLTAALLEAGFEVTAVDISVDLIELAQARAPKAHFIHASAYETEIRGHEAVVAVGEPLTYHAEDADADRLLGSFLQRAAEALPPGGQLIFDVIGLGEPSLSGRTWTTGDDWAVVVETSENQAERILVRNIETFRRAGKLYRRGRETHTVRLFDVRSLCDQLASCGFVTETARSYGAQQLPFRRHAFFATRTGAAV